MSIGSTLRALGWREALRYGLLGVGWLLIASTPFVGVLPGPGGVVVFALGAGLVLKNSLWAKRRYVRLKRRWPRHGAWADWGLRRASARRRVAIEKERAACDAAPEAD